MKILVTAFEPFGGERENPTTEIITRLQGVDTLLLPVSFRDAALIALDKIRETKPDAVIMLGQAGGRAVISLERCAINVAEAKTPDNDGYLPKGESIVVDGPAAYLCRLQLQSLCQEIRATGVPCQVSNTAGLYVCNTLYYSVMHHCPSLPALFIHVPYSPRQAVEKTPTTPSMNVSDMVTAVATIIAFLQQHREIEQ